VVLFAINLEHLADFSFVFAGNNFDLVVLFYTYSGWEHVWVSCFGYWLFVIGGDKFFTVSPFSYYQ
jgi:hypothetical protein